MELSSFFIAILLAIGASMVGGARFLEISKDGWGAVAVVGLALYGLMSGAAGYVVSSVIFLLFRKKKEDKEAPARRRRWSIAGAVLAAGAWAFFLAHRKPL